MNSLITNWNYIKMLYQNKNGQRDINLIVSKYITNVLFLPPLGYCKEQPPAPLELRGSVANRGSVRRCGDFGSPGARWGTAVWCVRRVDVALLASILRGNVLWLVLRAERRFYSPLHFYLQQSNILSLG